MDNLQIESGQELNAIIARVPDWTGWLATFVINEEGQSVGTDGTSASLSNPTDLAFLISLRTKADVIVTTGATARAEKYKASRLAPIAFLTRNPDSLLALPAFTQPGPNKNILLTPKSETSAFLDSQSKLRDLGFKSFLFEGGRNSLNDLLEQTGEIELVLNIANTQNPMEVDSRIGLEKLFAKDHKAQLIDDFVAGDNRVTHWRITR